MSYSDHAFARASRNTPVRDELVVHLDDIVPELKSPSGISIIKHTKRGQSENRRLRFDTDVATLEVFRTSTNYLNRKILTRTYNLSLLEEVRTLAFSHDLCLTNCKYNLTTLLSILLQSVYCHRE